MEIWALDVIISITHYSLTSLILLLKDSHLAAQDQSFLEIVQYVHLSHSRGKQIFISQKYCAKIHYMNLKGWQLFCRSKGQYHQDSLRQQ